MHHHPWRDLRGRENVVVHWRALPPGLLGVTDGRDQIWLDRFQLQVERRCTLTHELVHIDLGHDGCQAEREEGRVRRLTAERLIDTRDLIQVCLWAHDVHQAADELWVTVDVLLDRLRGLSAFERAAIASAVAAAHGYDVPTVDQP